MLREIDNLATGADFTFTLANTSEALPTSKYVVETSDRGNHSINYAYIWTHISN
jgi:hypothetical protein